MKRLVWCVALLPFSPFACSNGDTTTDGGPDATGDGTTADVRSDATLDAPKDSAKDSTSDAQGDAAADAADASDATADAPADSQSDALSDGAADAADASDAGGSIWHSPNCDGIITSGEYGDANYQTTSGSQVWYVTWDATNLYVALAVANVGEGNVLYVGYSGNGLTAGQTYDSTGGTLPFKADAVVYAKHGYNEVRLVNADAGTWGNANANSPSFSFCDDGNTTREEVIPWALLGAGSIPASFRFLAYATSIGGSVYGPIPTSNPSGLIGTSAVFPHDFYVSSTANGSGAFPFATTE